MTTEQLHILQHALGLDQYGGGESHRNHFCAGPGGADHQACLDLARAGFMRDHGVTALSGGSSVFTVTAAGVDHVALNSSPRPPPTKRSRSQSAYREYREFSECYPSFAVYLGIMTNREWDSRLGYRFVNPAKHLKGPYAKTVKEAKEGYKAILNERNKKGGAE